MTAAARITQADMDRAAKAITSAGIERARIIMRLEKSEIEIIIGDTGESEPVETEEWTDEDV